MSRLRSELDGDLQPSKRICFQDANTDSGRQERMQRQDNVLSASNTAEEHDVALSLHDSFEQVKELAQQYPCYPPLPAQLHPPDVFSKEYLLKYYPELFFALSFHFTTVCIAMIAEYVDYVFYPSDVAARLHYLSLSVVPLDLFQPCSHNCSSATAALSSSSSSSSPSSSASSESSISFAAHVPISEFGFDPSLLQPFLENGVIWQVGDVIFFEHHVQGESKSSCEDCMKQFSGYYFLLAPGNILVRGSDPWGYGESTGVPTRISRHFRDLFLKYRRLLLTAGGVSGFCLRHDDEIFMRHFRSMCMFDKTSPSRFPEEWKFCYQHVLYVSFSSQTDNSGREIPLWYDFETPSMEGIFEFFELTKLEPRFNLKVHVSMRSKAPKRLDTIMNFTSRGLSEVGNPDYPQLAQCRVDGPNGGCFGEYESKQDFKVNLPISLENWFKTWLESYHEQNNFDAVYEFRYKSDYESRSLNYGNGPWWYS